MELDISKIVRIPPREKNIYIPGNGLGNLFLDKIHDELESTLKDNGYKVRYGTPHDQIHIVGSNGIQNHLKQSGAYTFCSPQLSLGEVYKFVSIFVGFQTLDPDLHYHDEEGNMCRKPLIIYGNREYYKDVIDILYWLKEVGCIKQEIEGPDGLVRFAETPEQYMFELNRKQIVNRSEHGLGSDSGVEAPPLGQILHPNAPKRADLSVGAFYSASNGHAEEFVNDVTNLGHYSAKRGWNYIDGFGNSGLMQVGHLSASFGGAFTVGVNCPHIVILEGMPGRFSLAVMKPEIYSRKYFMYDESDSMSVSKGGAGSLQETLGFFVALGLGSKVVMFDGSKPIHAGHRNFKSEKLPIKPYIVNNFGAIWDKKIKLLEKLGIYPDRHFIVAESSEDVIRNQHDLFVGAKGLNPFDESKVAYSFASRELERRATYDPQSVVPHKVA